MTPLPENERFERLKLKTIIQTAGPSTAIARRRLRFFSSSRASISGRATLRSL